MTIDCKRVDFNNYKNSDGCYSYKLIQEVIYKLEKEGNDIMDPNFQNILIKY